MTTSLVDRRWLYFAACGMLLAAATAAPAWAQDSSELQGAADPAAVNETDAAIPPDAQAVLDRMTATFGKVDRYSITAQITRDEVLAFGYKLQHRETARMWVQTPNRLRLEVEGDIKNRTYVYDGSHLTIFAPDQNIYSVTAAPGTLRELVGALLEAGVEMPLIDMLYQGVVGRLADDVRAGRLVGDSKVDGVLTDHLAFRQPEVDWQLWVEKGGQALPRALLITTRYELGDPQYEAILRWDLEPRMPAKSFEFVPPSGATRIPFHTQLVAVGGDK
jgi:hypothetical protein